MSLVFSKTAGSYPAATPEDPMKDSFDPFDDGTSEKDEDEEDDTPKPGVPFPTKYEFADVDIPADFLSMTNPPPDAKPITFEQIDFAQTVLPQFKGRYAVVLDNVLSPSECTALLQLAEQSVPVDQRGKNGDRFWRPALVNVGNGFEVLESDYRRSDRIIWDQQEVVDRLWARCLQAPQIKERLQAIENEWDMLDLRSKRARGMVDRVRWEFRSLNKRMRFLRYRPGGFFRPHCDGPYTEPTGPGENVVRTLLTVHLYLNDSQAEVGQDAADLVGGATSFLSFDETKKMDVNPRAGRVLIFQHAGLYHSGDDVLAGTKYTMRTDILYERVLYE